MFCAQHVASVPKSAVTSDEEAADVAKAAEERAADYKRRASAFGLTPFEAVQAAMTNEDENVLFLDVRLEREVDATSDQRLAFVTLQDPKFVYIPVAGVSASDIEETKKGASDHLQGNESATIIIYCADGERAKMAATTLRGLGFSKVMNIGGFPDLRGMLELDAMMAMTLTVHDCNCKNQDDCRTNKFWQVCTYAVSVCRACCMHVVRISRTMCVPACALSTMRADRT